jgi:hypothetical protein
MVAMKFAISEMFFVAAERCPVIRDAKASWDLPAFRSMRGERSGGRLAMKDAIS